MQTIILGPTGVGKSAYALKLAQDTQREIVSVDALQVYKYLNIGTAKLSKEEQAGIPHQLIDIVEPDVKFSLASYLEAATKLLEANPSKQYIFCGGTGFYLNALLNGVSNSSAGRDDAYRAELDQLEKTEGKNALWRKLLDVDNVSAGRLHPNDSMRVKRALEIFQLTGIPASQAKKTPPLITGEIELIGLTMDREQLYNRLDSRVDAMLKKGLIAEVQGLMAKYSPELPALQAIGYKELIGHLQGQDSLAEAVAKIKQNTRNFAKRQFTWFKSFKNINWEVVNA